MYTIVVYSACTGNSDARCRFDSDAHRSETDRLVGVAVRITLALLLVLLGGLFGLLRSLLFLLLALALRLVFVTLVVTVTAALALLALLVGIHSSTGLGFRLSLFGRGETCRWDGRSGENLRSRGGLGNWGRGAIDIVPVEVLVLGVPLRRSLLVGAAEFLGMSV
jgi:hypothetical protein